MAFCGQALSRDDSTRKDRAHLALATDIIAQACREAALKRAEIAKRQSFVPPAKAGGKEEPAEDQLKIGPNDVGGLDRERSHAREPGLV
jgi:hypothetical protein